MLIASMTRMDARTCSARGRRRHNADAATTHHDAMTDRYAFAVADGIGDTEAAAHAARLAAITAVRSAARSSRAGPHGVINAVLAAQEAVLDGDAVLVVATPLPPHVGGYAVAWAGDCRAYHWDGTSLTQLTADQTVAEYLRARGESVAPRLEHVVTNSVRLARPHNLGLAITGGAPGRLALTTDGVHRNLDDSQLANIIGGTGDSRATATALVLAALHHGGADNATALVVTGKQSPGEG